MLKRKIYLPVEIKILLKILNKNGYQAYVVGGAVRDTLLGKDVHDYDITTDALPEKVLDIFKDRDYPVAETGLKHGTVTVRSGSYITDITTFRLEGKYSDGRRPDNVTFVKDLKEDLSRRDFTINALAYSPKTGLIDYFGGESDLKSKIIRCVGNAEERFNEDSLRILRAIRFANQLKNFVLDPYLVAAAYKCKNELKNVSVERVQMELNKILATENSFRYLFLFATCYPDIFNTSMLEDNTKLSHKGLQVYSTLNDSDRIENLTILRIYDILTENVFDYLKYDNMTKRFVNDITECYNLLKSYRNDFFVGNDLKFILKDEFMSRFSLNIIYRAIHIIIRENQIALDIAENVDKGISEIIKNKEPVFISQLAINGDELKDLGLSGKKLGECMNFLLKCVHKNPLINTRNALIELTKKFKRDSC